ncbi:MAG: hypothetical protein Terrestrivirus3_127 [Terrestrivirus sp.]|uniref:Uncharacterized protein n=1 Tax=Terrestrivirus sp. TaxID=2487775 RepID=A0A3G4ZLZ1_9VIRU|nr:MAG: hypothetical protein Terrestrivirus3_127 [Terrestrivirus sp.]
MPFLSTLFFGIKDFNRRSFYPSTNVQTINEQTDVDKNNNIHGIITKSEEIENNRHLYHIDNVVLVETVSSKKETEIVQELENDFNSMRTFTLVSVCSTIGSTVLAVYGFNPTIPGTNKTLFDYVPQAIMPCIGGFGCIGSVVSGYKLWDLSSELQKWKKNISFHQGVRTSILNIGTKKIYDKRMIGVYLTQREGFDLWKNNIREFKNNAFLATHRTMLTSKVEFVEKFASDHPLEPKYARYFCNDENMRKVDPFVDDCIKHKQGIVFANDKYEQEKRTLSYQENNEINIATQPFDIAKNILTTAKTVDTIVDTGSEIAEDINDAHKGQTYNERKRKEFNRDIKHIAKDTTYIFGQASIESIRQQTINQIREKYDTQRRCVVNDHNESLCKYLPGINNTYFDCCKILFS